MNKTGQLIINHTQDITQIPNKIQLQPMQSKSYDIMSVFYAIIFTQFFYAIRVSRRKKTYRQTRAIIFLWSVIFL